MIIIGLIFAIACVSYIANKWILKGEILVYITALVVSVVSYLYQDTVLTNIVNEGFLAISMFYVVMVTGAFVHNSKLSKRLRSVRKILSISGFILLLPHAIIYLLYHFAGTVSYEWFGIIAFVIMIPLFVTSFHWIKRKFHIKKWYKMHTMSYLAYTLIFVHVMMVTTENTIIYLVLFGTYSVIKLYNFAFESKRLFKASLVTTSLLVGVFFLSGQTLAIEATSYDSALPETYVLQDGTYQAQAEGYEDLIVTLQITISNQEITDIELLDCGCTEEDKKGLYLIEANNLVDRLLAAQSLEVDTVAGTTHTTHGILEAMEEAILQAIVIEE